VEAHRNVPFSHCGDKLRFLVFHDLDGAHWCGPGTVRRWIDVEPGDRGSSHTIQSIFDPITVDTGVTRYVIGEFGCGLALSSIVGAFLFWRRRGELNPT
jgi:hypothetical protein